MSRQHTGHQMSPTYARALSSQLILLQMRYPQSRISQASENPYDRPTIRRDEKQGERSRALPDTAGQPDACSQRRDEYEQKHRGRNSWQATRTLWGAQGTDAWEGSEEKPEGKAGEALHAKERTSTLGNRESPKILEMRKGWSTLTWWQYSAWLWQKVGRRKMTESNHDCSVNGVGSVYRLTSNVYQAQCWSTLETPIASTVLHTSVFYSFNPQSDSWHRHLHSRLTEDTSWDKEVLTTCPEPQTRSLT